MIVEYLLIGQGISGTFLSYYLQKAGRSFVVIDDNGKHSSSKMAAGIINPVTGRRLVTTWHIDEIMPFAWEVYIELGNLLKVPAISHKNVIDFFPNPQMRHTFLQRLEEDGEYLHAYPEQNHFNAFFNYDFGCGEIRPVYIAHLENILPEWRNELLSRAQLLEETFEISDLKVMDAEIRYRDIKAERIIFCDGPNGIGNPFFNSLPFAPNKGEAMIVEIPGLPDHHIYKKGFLLSPLLEKGMFWIGSSYEWDFENDQPTNMFYVKTEQLLKSWLKIPFTIREHKAGVRPATLERRPFVGFHPIYKNVGILNGMGTKGCSLAPYFAKQMTGHLLHGDPILPEADVSRFHKILSR